MCTPLLCSDLLHPHPPTYAHLPTLAYPWALLCSNLLCLHIFNVWCIHLPSFPVIQPSALNVAHVHSLMHPHVLLHCASTSSFDMYTLIHLCTLLRCTAAPCSEIYTSPLSDASTCPHGLFSDLLLRNACIYGLGASMCTPLFSDLLLSFSPTCTRLHSLVHTTPSFIVLRPLPQLTAWPFCFPPFHLPRCPPPTCAAFYHSNP
jgi:hypothetical protein